ncbi:hypothetical protein COW96_01210, partial [Candidatus Roizmanbacteria bacterium CG22_combo_CG10-13_8_21_14_all_33_16]
MVSAIDLRSKFSIWETKIQKKDSNVQLIIDVVQKYLTKEKIKFKNKRFDFKISSEVPVGRGLGSSAAF